MPGFRAAIGLMAAAFAAAGSVAGAACPDQQGTGGAIEVDGTRLAAGVSTQVIAGGPLALADCEDVPGDGQISPAPSLNVLLAGGEGRTMELSTRGGCDTVLLVADAAGIWHFDDDSGDGLDATLQIGGADGSYDIWVGTHALGTCRARITIQALD